MKGPGVMGRRWGRALCLALALLALGASSDEDTLARNRQRLDRLRSDPVLYARLMDDLRSFFALPPERQREIRDIDTKLHAGDLGRQTRLWGVLERYDTWLDGLPEKDRHSVLNARTASDRLRVIRFLRDREWAERAPPSIKAELGKLPPNQRQQRINQLRAEERAQRRQWDRSLPPPAAPNVPKPAAFLELPDEVKTFVLEELLPAVPPDRLAVLGEKEGRWPDYLRTISDLSRSYLTYRPLPTGPIRTVRELPNELRKLMAAEKGKASTTFKGLGQKQGWPDFALTLEKSCREAKLKCPELGACRPGHYPQVTQAFLKEQMAEFADELSKLEGQWPGYPERVTELARSRGLIVPGLMLPGDPAMWSAALQAR